MLVRGLSAVATCVTFVAKARKCPLKTLFRIEGVPALLIYVIGYFVSGQMPASYYCNGDASLLKIAHQLLVQDGFQCLVHFFEHKFHFPCHLLHHEARDPQMKDAYSGHIADTLLGVILPLFLTSRIVRANLASYYCFGAIYATWLLIIHDSTFHAANVLSAIGIVTPKYHAEHHKNPTSNFSHLFTVYDKILGTQKK